MLRSLIHRLSRTSGRSHARKGDSPSRRLMTRALRIENLENRITFNVSYGGFEEASGFHITDFEVDTLGNTYRVGRYRVSADLQTVRTVDLDPNTTSPTGADILSLPPGVESSGFIAKFSPKGVLDWVHSIDISLARLTVAPAGNRTDVFVVGTFYGTIPVGNLLPVSSVGGGDSIAIKLSVHGDFVWCTPFTQTTNLEWPTDIDTDSSGNVYVALYQNPMESHSIVRLNANGSFAWQRTLYTNNYFQTQLEVTSTNEIVIAGNFRGTVDMDPSSKTRWGSSGSDRSVFISRFSTAGNLIWTGAFTGRTLNNLPSASWVTGLKVDGSNNILVTGGYSGQIDVNPGSKVTNLPISTNYNQYTAFASDDMFAVKLSSTGSFVRSGGWQGPAGTSFARTSLDIDNNGNLYITGHLTVGAGSAPWRVDLDPTAGISEHIVGLNTTFVLRLNTSGTFAWSRTIGITEDSDGKVGRGDFEALTWIAVGPSNEIYLAFGVESAKADLAPSAGSVWLETDSERNRRRGILRWNQS